MRWRWSRSSRAEDRLESWVTKQHQRRVLAGDTIPCGPCPDDTFLRDLARKSKSIALSDPRIDHTANCRQCMSRLLELKARHQARQKRVWFSMGIASCLLAFAAVFVGRYAMERKALPNNGAVLTRTIDLGRIATAQSANPNEVKPVLFPPKHVTVTVILPSQSKPGVYRVAVTRDRSGSDVLAEGTTSTVINAAQQSVTVSLDLRSAQPGLCFLSATYEPQRLDRPHLPQIECRIRADE